MPSETMEYRAALADLLIIIKGRCIEAADTIAHMDVRGLRPAKEKSLWPAIQIETLGIGGHHPGYGINGNRVAYRPSAAAISRAEEVLYTWMPAYVERDDCRVLLGRWSASQAMRGRAHSFRAYCRENGLSRSTADRRVDDALKAIAAAVLKNAQSLQGPNWSRVVPMMPNSTIPADKMAPVTSWMAADARPRHYGGDEEAA